MSGPDAKRAWLANLLHEATAAAERSIHGSERWAFALGWLSSEAGLSDEDTDRMQAIWGGREGGQ